MKICFLINNGYGIGGTIRSTFNLAQALATQHEVEIVSVFRHRDAPAFALGGGVRLVPLVDLREDSPEYAGDEPEHQRRSAVFPAEDWLSPRYSRLTDRRIAAWLSGTDADVVFGTRPGLNVHLARQAPRRLIRIAQEHSTFEAHPAPLKRRLRRHYPSLDAITTVTQADAACYRSRLRLPGVRVAVVPNSVPA
ncbi:glycosyltransferase family 4 protein, partial [Streptomyces sp. A7024]|nr:glycosyltransferase family 4 protein [Streptomyces coryli]